MQIKVYSGFSKRRNSTKQPTGGTTVTVVLKYPVDKVNPSFDVAATYAGSNYIYVSDWGRYYFVTGVTYLTKDIVTLKCASDPMASAKTDIGSVKAPVEFATSSTNLLVTDSRNRPTFKYDVVTTTILDLTAKTPAFMHSPGRYVCGIVCDQGLKYFVFTESNLDNLCHALFKTSFIQAITNAFFDMKNVLISCIWLPFIPVNSGTEQIITVSGESLLDYNGNVVKAPVVSDRYHEYDGGSVTISYPYDGTYNVDNYLDAPPYTSGSIYLPFVGVVPFDPDIFFNDKTITLKMQIDQYTGDLVYEMHDSSGNMLATYQGNCATQIPVAGQTSNPSGAIPGALAVLGGGAGIAAGIATMNPAAIIGGVGAIAGGSAAGISSMSHHTQVNGNVSSGVGAQLPLVASVTVRTRRPTETAIETAFQTDNGWTYYKDETISNLSGYVKCYGASVSCSLTPGEIDTINGYMNSGFYYE